MLVAVAEFLMNWGNAKSNYVRLLTGVFGFLLLLGVAYPMVILLFFYHWALGVIGVVLAVLVFLWTRKKCREYL